LNGEEDEEGCETSMPLYISKYIC